MGERPMVNPTQQGRAGEPFALARVPAKLAAPLAAQAKLPPPALALVTTEATPRQFVDALVRREMHADAIRFLAFALPGREAIWWACQCVRYTKPVLPAPQEQALVAATRWVIDPSDARRQEAE